MFDEKGNLVISTLSENNELYQKEYEKTFGLVDIAPSSALGSDLAITAEMKKISDEFTQNAYMQNSPYEATGEGLDNLCFLAGITRKINEHSVCLVTFSGANDIVISKGTAVKNSLTDEEFLTNEQGIIIDGIFTVFTTSVNAGRIVCNANTLTLTDLENVTVSNPQDGFVGFLKESDTDLRKRLETYSNSLNPTENLMKQLRNLRNVKYVNVESNKELVADANGIPAKSSSIIVLGGESKAIANEIHTNLISDKKLVGTTSEVVVESLTNNEYVYYFSRPDPVPVTVEVTITKDDSFNPDDVGVIKESILDFFSDKFSIANDVLIDSLYIPIQQDYNNNNPFFRGINQVAIKLDNASVNIPIAYNKYATLNSDDLIIIVV
ncbi:MAG: baseplate J/gp47 family protein [Thiotrichales bacterium]|nr:baseplate J/gp47 family protein [Thiotrichales bacterium]